MHKTLTRTLAGIMSLLFVGQIMIFGDGASQGILHADTIASAAEAVEEAQNADQLAEEFESVTEDLGEVEFFDIPQSAQGDVQLFSEALEENAYTVDSETETNSDVNYELAAFEEIASDALAANSLTISGKVQKGTVSGHAASDNTPIYVRIFDGDWNEIASKEVSDGGEYSVTADTTGVHHVKFECDGYLPFYLKDFGTGSFQIGSGDSLDTVTLVPGGMRRMTTNVRFGCQGGQILM